MAAVAASAPTPCPPTSAVAASAPTPCPPTSGAAALLRLQCRSLNTSVTTVDTFGRASCDLDPALSAARLRSRQAVEHARAPPAKRRKLSSIVPCTVPTVQEFYNYMRNRECVRIRREVHRLPLEHWYVDPLMRGLRFTNVRREDDRTTRVMRAIGDEATLDRWRDAAPPPPEKGWSEAQRHLAGLIVFNTVLWRAFGTSEFACEVGFLDLLHWDTVYDYAPAVRAAMACWSRGQHCFTDAYGPARTGCHAEARAKAVGGRGMVHRLYTRTCERLTGVWKQRLDIARTAETSRSWQGTTRYLMRVTGYGGTGFLAKEIVQDLLHTPLFSVWSPKAGAWRSTCIDTNRWCAVGPGARRGLNRLRGQPLNADAYGGGERLQEEFLSALLEVFKQRHEYWPQKIEGVRTADLELHDVQFQLCEFDKYERSKGKGGRVRRYEPPVSGEEDTLADDKPRSHPIVASARRKP
eukprot:NODE_4283_length_1910_cov_21.413909.p1 GENE.NODE_4283_length_1910_cov_21.413909~~NODE_4283_length_1910_cov_21.413909.p1  ORF type:complete len:490 (-),score=110.65 NODE_4283_length_1910_cov_21.413909:439-1836(-)